MCGGPDAIDILLGYVPIKTGRDKRRDAFFKPRGNADTLTLSIQYIGKTLLKTEDVSLARCF